jgi:hypothetical protein
MNNPIQQLQQKVQQDITAIHTEVHRITGLQSRWNGAIYLPDANDPDYATAAGTKEWTSDISIRRDYVTSVHYFHICLHEALHGFSVGMTPINYIAYRGYEEGVIEQCTRLLSSEIAVNLNMAFTGGYGAYQTEIGRLETLRSRTNIAERDFYLGLLATPLDNREETVIDWIDLADPNKTRQQIVSEITPIIQGLH